MVLYLLRIVRVIRIPLLSREDLIVATRACCLQVEIHSTTGKEEHRVAVDYTRAGITYSGSQGGDRCIEGREGETGVVL